MSYILEITVADIADVIAQFDQIQVWRSDNGVDGDYQEITGAVLAGASITGTEEGPFTVDGLTFEVDINGLGTQLITFDTTDPITAANLATLMSTLLVGATVADVSDTLRITNDETGTDSTLEIIDGTALDELGFEEGDLDVGSVARVALVGGTSTYSFTDESGLAASYYRVRFFNSATSDVSAFQPPFQATAETLIGSGSLISGFIDLADLDGTPLVGREVTVYYKYVPPLVSGTVGIMGREVVLTTDADGHAASLLVHGAVVDVAIIGTNIVREITVPSSGSSFNLMTAVATADDVFQIHTPDIPAAVRRA